MYVQYIHDCLYVSNEPSLSYAVFRVFAFRELISGGVLKLEANIFDYFNIIIIDHTKW